MSGDDNIIRFPHIERIEIARPDLARFIQRFYVLVNREPVAVETMQRWETSFVERRTLALETGIDPWRVAETQLGPANISTVFLGLDHNFFGGKPILFETMIFGGSHDGYQDRCSTWDEAEAMHARAVELVRGHLQVV